VLVRLCCAHATVIKSGKSPFCCVQSCTSQSPRDQATKLLPMPNNRRKWTRRVSKRVAGVCGGKGFQLGLRRRCWNRFCRFISRPINSCFSGGVIGELILVVVTIRIRNTSNGQNTERCQLFLDMSCWGNAPKTECCGTKNGVDFPLNLGQ
jgi:hypothetical protein